MILTQKKKTKVHIILSKNVTWTKGRIKMQHVNKSFYQKFLSIPKQKLFKIPLNFQNLFHVFTIHHVFQNDNRQVQTPGSVVDC